MGFGISYTVYDSESGEIVTTGTTDENGRFSIEAGQYAVINVPEDTVWRVYKIAKAGYELKSVDYSGDNVVQLSGEQSVMYQEEKNIKEAMYYIGKWDFD